MRYFPLRGDWAPAGNISRVANDMLVVIAGVLLAYGCSLFFNLSERLNAWLASYEYVQLDELPLTVLVLALLSVWFSHRRMQESHAEIARRRIAEAQLLSSQQLYKTLFDGDLTGNVVLDMEGKIGMHNSAFTRLCRPINPQATPLFGFDWPAFVQTLIARQELNYSKMQLRRADNLPCYVSARFIYVPPTASQPAQIHGYLVDMTEQCLVEQDLARTLKENRVLARHAMQVQEQERKYIASEIHDETGQYLTAIRMDALALQKSTPEQMPVIAVRIASNISHVQQSVRALIKHLRPPALDALGLIGAIERIVSDWRKLHPKVQCQLTLALDESRMQEHINIVVYRVIQEALTNISRHAGASEVMIALQTLQTKTQPSQLQLQIRDNGQGLPHGLATEGVGLIGMRERVESLQGQFTIQSQAGHGTQILCLIPLAESTSQTLITETGVTPYVR